jgi:hypothetical protein
LAVFPTRKAFEGADPKSTVARAEQPEDTRTDELIPGLPGCGVNSIEFKDAEFRAQPKIAIGRLRNAVDVSFDEPASDGPRVVRVLADVERWIQGNAAIAAEHEKYEQRWVRR